MADEKSVEQTNSNATIADALGDSDTAAQTTLPPATPEDCGGWEDAWQLLAAAETAHSNAIASKDRIFDVLGSG